MHCGKVYGQRFSLEAAYTFILRHSKKAQEGCFDSFKSDQSAASPEEPGQTKDGRQLPGKSHPYFKKTTAGA